LLQRKKDYLDGLNGDHDAYAKALLQLNDVERQLIDVSEQYASFIDERVLWIRSTFVFSYRDIRPAVDASSWLAATDNWKTLGKTFIPNNRVQAVVLSLSVLAFCVLGYAQRPIRRTITELGQSVSRRGFYQFSPTVRTVLLTVVASVMWPGLAAFAGLLLSGSPSDFVRAFGAALLWTASMWLPLEVVRQVCRTKGLAESHLQWPPGLLRVIRKQVQSFLVVGVPLLLLSFVLESQTKEPLWSSSLGRAAFVVFLVISAFVIQRMLFARSGVVQQTQVTSPLPRVLNRTWCILLAISPLLLAALAILGYYDTSQVLAIRLFHTAGVFCLLGLVHALFVRWVLMRRRRLTIEQARQRRSTESDSPASHDPASITAAQDTFDEVDLGTVSEQTVRLLRTVVILAAVAAGWLIWDDVVPALSILRNYPVWPGLDVSLADLSLGVIIVAVTYVATRNVPGLLELTLLNYLPVDTGARFATTTLCRYAIAAGGVALAGRSLGITWGSIQWLIAAMGIGLGFGLQEIFANFISGIILLFERPIRVGDVITLGETTGVVTRIRMRATTVTDWDRKEYVVPNKDLITGRLLNWTLSDQTHRITIPVGVAYGSDTDHARSLLLDVAKQHPLILEDPEPIATFEAFGDSTLNLVLRCYLPDLDNLLPTISDLHSAIDRTFRDAKIEIAFPQRDLHVRSFEPPLKTIDQRARDESPLN
jgi:potassium efflux system protein